MAEPAHRLVRASTRVLWFAATVCLGLVLATPPVSASPVLDDRFQKRLPKRDGSLPDFFPPPSGGGSGGGGTESGSGGGGSGGGGGGEARPGPSAGGAGGGERGDRDLGRFNPWGSGQGDDGAGGGDLRSRLPGQGGDRVIFYPGDFTSRTPVEGDRQWREDGSCDVYREGYWSNESAEEARGAGLGLEFDGTDGSWRVYDPETETWGEWNPAIEGQIERDGDTWRRWEYGEWGDWNFPEEGALERRADGWSRVWERDGWREGSWSEWRPPLEGEIEWRDDSSFRRFSGGEWGEWRSPREGDMEWSDGEWREFRDGEWSSWEEPLEGDLEIRGEEEREFRDGEWGEWRARHDLDDARRRDRFDERFQRDLPAQRDRDEEEEEDEDDVEYEEPAQAQTSPGACSCGGINLGGSLGGFGQVVLWVLLGIALVVVGAFVYRWFDARRRDLDEDEDEDDLFDDEEEDEAEEEDEDDGTGALVDAALHKPLADYDELAAAERWADAMHALFLHVLRAQIRRAGVKIKSSVTSRELTRLLGLDAHTLAEFRALVLAVERSRFALEPTTRETWMHFRTRGVALLQAADTPSYTAEAA